jgi:hypothetical protein
MFPKAAISNRSLEALAASAQSQGDARDQPSAGAVGARDPEAGAEGLDPVGQPAQAGAAVELGSAAAVVACA